MKNSQKWFSAPREPTCDAGSRSTSPFCWGVGGSSQAPRKGGAASRAEALGKEGSPERAGHRAPSLYSHWGLVARTMPGTTGLCLRGHTPGPWPAHCLSECQAPLFPSWPPLGAHPPLISAERDLDVRSCLSLCPCGAGSSVAGGVSPLHSLSPSTCQPLRAQRTNGTLFPPSASH